METINSLRLIEAKQHLGIGVRRKHTAFTFQFLAQLTKVVDLAVVGDPQLPIPVAHRHVAVGGKVKYGEPPRTQPDPGSVRESLLPYAGIIRPAMGLDVRHL